MTSFLLYLNVEKLACIRNVGGSSFRGLVFWHHLVYCIAMLTLTTQSHDCSHFGCQWQVGSPVYPHFWPTGHRSWAGWGVVGRVLQRPWGVRIIRMTQNSGRYYSYGYSFILKQTHWDQPNEETQGKNIELLYPLPVESGHITLPAHQCVVHQPGSSTELWCPEFVSHVGMIYWIIGRVTELHPQPSFPTQKLGWLKASALVTWLVFLVTSPHTEPSC